VLTTLKRIALVGCALLATAGNAHAAAPPALGAEHLVMGNPSDATPDRKKRNNYLVLKRQYVLSYNNANGTPNWVSWRLSKKWLGKAGRGGIPFAADKSLPAGFFIVQPNSFRDEGFARGHLCPAADRGRSARDVTATFLTSNMMPQSPRNNSLTWKALEDYCRQQVKLKDVYVVAGPAGRGGWGQKGHRTYLRSGRGKVQVPGKTWKVILVVPAGVSHPDKVTVQSKMIAVIMPNSQEIQTDWEKYRVPVREVEDLTGYTFFSRLPPKVAVALKGNLPDGMLAAFVKGCVIGNKRKKIFHVPTGRYYQQMKTSPSAVFFKDAEAAKKAGYTASQR
jgi:endonuclease G